MVMESRQKRRERCISAREREEQRKGAEKVKGNEQAAFSGALLRSVESSIHS